jgi:EAL domain-containing protein (putative c-di-GMP-specific phosphodiesterase class I)
MNLLMSNKFLQQFKAKTVIFGEGDIGDCAYIIEKGRVQISIEKNESCFPLLTLLPGDIFGEMAILDGMTRSATATALEDCELSVVSRDLLTQRIDASDPIVRLLISLLLRRIRSSNRAFKGEAEIVPEKGMGNIVRIDEARDRLKLENELVQGLEREEFFLEYQPIVQLQTRDIVGFEALVRWNSPSRGRVRPDLFIDAAEQTAVIIPLGEWILNQAFEDLVFLQKSLRRPDLSMSINVSVRQLNDVNFVHRLLKAQEKAKINPQQIKLEVTERVLQEGEQILESIQKVRDLGYSFSMDDFGTGYSSLTSLFKLKVDVIKVDRSFVSTFIGDKKSMAIVKAVIAMGIELGLIVVAEGIEREEEAKTLEMMGCLLGQGYLFSRPKAVSDLLDDYLGRHKKSVA